jgi:hypothetical protein
MISRAPFYKLFKHPVSLAHSNPKRLQVRFLKSDDIDLLLKLEAQKWEPGQAANAQDMLARIQNNPQLCVGVFDSHTGQALASLFLKPTSLECLMQSANWNECASLCTEAQSSKQKALFGISFSSIQPQAADALFEFFWPHALKAGWRHIYLGSPVPGFKKWLTQNPQASIYRYVHSRCLNLSRRQFLPRDPQLRYYGQRGFRHIVYIRPNYFPHEASQDFGVLLRGTVPLSGLSALWQRVPLRWLCGLQKMLFRIL